MADVSMDYAALSTLAQEISGMHTQLEDVLTSFESLVSSTKGAWKGKAHQKFVSSYQGLEVDMRSISAKLEEYASKINKAASDMSGEDKSAATGITGATILSF